MYFAISSLVSAQRNPRAFDGFMKSSYDCFSELSFSIEIIRYLFLKILLLYGEKTIMIYLKKVILFNYVFVNSSCSTNTVIIFFSLSYTCNSGKRNNFPVFLELFFYKTIHCALKCDYLLSVLTLG